MALFNLFGGSDKLLPSWSYDAKAMLVSSAATGVLCGKRAIIIGTKDGRIVCLDELGHEVWSYRTGEQLGKTEAWFVDESRVHSIDAPALLADVDLDGVPEVFTGSEQGVLYCLAGDGKLKWKHDCGGSIRSSPIAADINGDGKPEILVGSLNNKLTALTSDGKKLFEYSSNAAVTSVPGVLRRRDRSTIIIFGDDKGTLTAITAAQEVAWRLELGSRITAAPVFFSDPEEQRLIIGTHAGMLVCVSEHGERVWSYKTGGSIYNAAAIADVNEDGNPEIVFGSCDNTVYVLSTDGKRVWTYLTDFWVTMTPLIADVDGDGHPEVIAGSYDRQVYVLDGKGQYLMDYVPGISGIVNQAGHYGSVLTSDVGEQTGKQRCAAVLHDMIVGCALLSTDKGPLVVATTRAGMVDTLKVER